ncbi:Acyl-CoA hydrolase [Thermanaeromonas toyohensis ToBE]|uniref:Acyl-CoA hydrolase n=1 Tax=Thermanaeromonas toyohensis ToBE TaxID=698762 RepID=A0A1W1W0S0_9FIRM|nr:acetyl-CoA hydrolase/transferase C-terminal domain-containing protein [Thermanaeromonas toyohensis]SMB99232.1 Acyl-CoA hydrolase [Thermanaeromonas toyohensis ToBE]
MNVQDEYRRKLISIDEAVKMVKSGQTIGAAMTASTPVGLLSALGKRRDELENVRIITALTLGAGFDYFLDPSMKGHFLLESLFYGGYERKGHALGTVSFIPSNGRDWGGLILANNPLDIFWGTASPMDRYGYFSLSLSLSYEKDWLEAAKLVVLEINPNLPRTYGDTHVHISQVDYIVENERPLIEIPPAEPDAIDEAIGAYVAELIEDGSTIQLGIGGIPNAIARNLMNKKDLGVHTEMFTDGMVDLWEAGVITGRKKTLWPGKMVGAFALGTRKLYDFVRENLAVEFQRGRITNDPCVIAQNYKMVSINTALQIDLTGQVVSESIGPVQYSGTGGQFETAMGAQKSPGGKSIIALRSTAKNGTISTIVPSLPAGARVTLTRAEVDYVVTEYGIAHLKGRSIRDRVKLLISIAHPDFREELRKEAQMLELS